MFGNKEFIGLTVQGDVIRVARLKVSGKKVKLIKLDQFSLVEEIKTETPSLQLQGDGAGVFEESEDTDSIFGLGDDEDGDTGGDLGDLDLNDLDDLDDLNDLDDLDDFDDFDEAESNKNLSLDMVDESEAPQSNELILFNIFTSLHVKKINLGLNIPAGSTIFQVIRDTNFKEVKKKDLIQDVEDKLQSIYGVAKSKDNYSYEIREDGSLLLASIDHESPTLQLTNGGIELFSGKVIIDDIVPDEALLVGLARTNYDLFADEITAIIQFGKNQCRIIFMKGEEIWLVSPVITEGTGKKTFLNTVFSKILFQLDTGEVPNLDRILLANNTIGDEAVKFFEGNFPDIFVENLSFDPEFLDDENVDPSSVPSFTTAIGAAMASSGAVKDKFPDLSFIPSYVSDRQKIFKLQWHGMLILFLIFLTPITFNYFYNKNARQIESLTTELNMMESQIKRLTPIVQNANELSADLAILKEKLTLLDTLSRGTKEWSEKFRILNEGVRGINNTWLTSFAQDEGGAMIRGYTLYRNRIPRVIDIFDEATLLNVTIEEMREKEVFSFSILVKRFAASDSVFSPATPVEVQKLIGK
ncbi:MAG TPA: hypothetical protein VF181_12615 [Balneolaceae bacterium]